LLIHGMRDRVLSAYCSESIYRRASEPKDIILYDGADHGLDEVAEEVHQVIRDWAIEKLNNVVF